MNRRRYLLGAAGAATALLGGCTGSPAADAGGATVVETNSVSMVDSQFEPRNVHVAKGATVTWTNEDGTSHTVTAASEDWSMDATVDGGGSASHTFGQSGVYDVYCKFHGSEDLSGMSMKVAVGDASIENPLGGGDGGYEGGGY